MGFVRKAVLLYSVFWLSIFIHECGHYSASVAVGTKVDEMVIGWGPTVFETEMPFGGRLEVNLIPDGGHVIHENVSGTFHMFLIGSAGMFAAVSAAFFAFLLALYGLNPEQGFPSALKVAFRSSYLAWLLFPFRLIQFIFTWKLEPVVRGFWGLNSIFSRLKVLYGERVAGPVSRSAFVFGSWLALMSSLNLFPLGAGLDGTKLLALCAVSVFGDAAIGPLEFILNWLNWALILTLIFWAVQEVFVMIKRLKGRLPKEDQANPDETSGTE